MPITPYVQSVITGNEPDTIRVNSASEQRQEPRSQESELHVVLYQPEIPQNTGNLARTCAATRTPLHLIKPLGFHLSDRYLKRAGLDYWKHVLLYVHENIEELCTQHPYCRLVCFSARCGKPYWDFRFLRGVFWSLGLKPEDYHRSCFHATLIVWCRSPLTDLESAV